MQEYVPVWRSARAYRRAKVAASHVGCALEERVVAAVDGPEGWVAVKIRAEAFEAARAAARLRGENVTEFIERALMRHRTDGIHPLLAGGEFGSDPKDKRGPAPDLRREACGERLSGQRRPI
jgi:hypothetical protein